MKRMITVGSISSRFKVGHVDLEVPERILGQANFIRWGPPGDIHGVGLPHHRDD
jgi:hypothetical protein